MVPIHIPKDPLNKTPISGKIQIFPRFLTFRWKQDQGIFKLNGKPPKHRNQVLNNHIKIIISNKYG
ncbi:MAG: hypothetical protein A2Y79_03795 [Deltaproteobacteria bacterium RBG_13_43_22]|nr:MAG: hypothetical protein A2Y79_03795 [Deltaproteobacteria bacterium RBG_13_43_22]